jgi:hypothetical protein
LALAGLAVVVAAGGVAAGLVLTSGPSWPHPWCAQVMSTLYTGTGNMSQLEDALQHEKDAGALTGTILADEQAAASVAAAAANASNFNALDAIAAELAAGRVLAADAAQLNRACGKPGGWQSGKLNVPASG